MTTNTPPVLDAVEGAASVLCTMARIFQPPFALLRQPAKPPVIEPAKPKVPTKDTTVEDLFPSLSRSPARWEHRTGNSWFDRVFIISSIVPTQKDQLGVMSLRLNPEAANIVGRPNFSPTWSALNRQEADEMIDALIRARDRAFPLK